MPRHQVSPDGRAVAPRPGDRLSRSLAMPDDWAEELCALRNPELGDPVVGPPTLILSYDPQRGLWGIDPEDLRRDLASGLTLPGSRTDRDGHRRYSVRGARYRADVVVRPGKSSGRPLTVLLRVGRNDEELPRRAGRVTRPVELADLRHERECDVGLLWREVQRARRRVSEVERAGRALDRAHQDKQLFRHAELHGNARRHYEALRALLGLLRQRAQNTAVSVEGVVERVPGAEDADDPYLYVRIEGDGSLRDFDGALVEIDGVASSGKPPRTSVRDVTDRVLALELPQRGEWTTGTRVTVANVPRFAMKQHDRALEAFLGGRVEGDWDDLATLLVDPGRMKLPARPLPPRFFCDEDPDGQPLNDQQRQAVAGALATPHAFVIQGPPGTGKTTVISELIRQLVARDERVLMLAPSHVAVDEVLRRIGRKPGIRPLRLSWDEGKVAEELRCFLPDRVGSEFAAALRTPGPDSEERWQARHDSLRSEIGAVDRLLAALAARDRADAAVAAAVADVRTAQTDLTLARERQAQVEEERRRALELATAAFESANIALAQADTQEEAARAEVAAVRRPVDDLIASLDRLATTAAATVDAQTALQHAEQHHADWLRWWRGEAARNAAATEALQPHIAGAVVAAADASRQVHAAEARLRALPARRGPLARLADDLGIGRGARRSRAAELARRAWADAEQRRQHVEQERQRLLAEQQRLATDGRAMGQRLAEDVRAARSRWEGAQDERRRAGTQWVSAAEAVRGSPQPEPSDPAQLAEDLRTALDPGGSVARHVWAWLPPALVQARARLDGAAEERVACQRQRLDAENALAVARQAFADSRREGEAEDGRLSAAAERATTGLHARQRDRELAGRELNDAMTSMGYRAEPDVIEVTERRARLDRQLRAVPSYARLRRRWLELVQGLSGKDISAAVGTALERAVNVVCATTAGSARLGEGVDFDTLIVDEASRVIDSEFLIGAVRARRWILVGDEHQLPPHVDNQDEYHLHALAALHRLERRTGDSLRQAVTDLAAIWDKEDDEQRRFRSEEVEKVAARLLSTGEWPDLYGEPFRRAHARLGDGHGDPDRELLRAMRRHLVRSLLERAVAASPASQGLRQALVVQRRMVPAIAAIVKDPIYRGAYESPDPADLRRHGVYPLTTGETFTRPVVLLDTSSNPRRGSQQVGHGSVNHLERDWVVEACQRYEREMSRQDRHVTVSILCFYQAQAELIRRALKPPRYPGFNRLKFKLIAPIDRSQGQESDLVIVSFVRSNDRPGKGFGRWLQDVRRLNVACTRAHRALVLVGHGDMLRGLHTFEPAQRFYRHLFGLLATDDYRVIEDFV